MEKYKSIAFLMRVFLKKKERKFALTKELCACECFILVIVLISNNIHVCVNAKNQIIRFAASKFRD